MPGYQRPMMTLAADVVVFTVRGAGLEVLLIERGHPPFQGEWALPGGLVELDEDVDETARRELEEETGVNGLELEQFHAFGAPGRDPRGRLVSVAYLTLVRPDALRPRASSDAARVAWFPMDRLPPLAFDHADVLALARVRLLRRMEEPSGAFGFLPEPFTLAELRALFETVAGRRFEPRAFRRRALALELIEPAGQSQSRTRQGRAERLYRARPRPI